MANGRTKPSAKSGLGTFIYNKEKGTCLGRTAASWCKLFQSNYSSNASLFSVKITVFYIIFYSCLAAFWIACLAIFLSTVDPELPRFYGKGTIIGANPGRFNFSLCKIELSMITVPFLSCADDLLYLGGTCFESQKCRSYTGVLINLFSGVGYQPWLKEDPESTLIRYAVFSTRKQS
jgi:hypothetical protein